MFTQQSSSEDTASQLVTDGEMIDDTKDGDDDGITHIEVCLESFMSELVEKNNQEIGMLPFFLYDNLTLSSLWSCHVKY